MATQTNEKPTQFSLDVGTDLERKLAFMVQDDIQRGIGYLNQGQADRAVQAFKLAREKSNGHAVLSDIISHNLLTAYRQHVEKILRTDDHLKANPYIKEAAELRIAGPMKDDRAFRTKFADTFKNMGMDLYFARQYEPALFFFRKAIAVEPCPSYFVDLTNALAFVKTPARLIDYTIDYPVSELGNHIFITCSPKSGSTFLKNLLVNLTGFKDLFSVYAGLQNEHDLDLPQLIKFGNVNTVTQQHARASEANIQMMQAFGIRPVVLVRDIYDSLFSLLDFYSKGFTFSTFFEKEEFLSFSQDKKLDLLIEYAIPWYFQFVASWQRAEKEGRLEMMWLTYEELIADKPAAVAKVLAFNNLNASSEIITERIALIEGDNERNRFNKGVSGRGRAGVSAQHKERIMALAEFFPSTDFGVIGL